MCVPSVYGELHANVYLTHPCGINIEVSTFHVYSTTYHIQNVLLKRGIDEGLEHIEWKLRGLNVEFPPSNHATISILGLVLQGTIKSTNITCSLTYSMPNLPILAKKINIYRPAVEICMGVDRHRLCHTVVFQSVLFILIPIV